MLDVYGNSSLHGIGWSLGFWFHFKLLQVECCPGWHHKGCFVTVSRLHLPWLQLPTEPLPFIVRRDDSGGRSGKQSSGDRKQVLDSDDTKNSNSESDKDSNSQGKNNGNSNNNNNKNTSGNGSVNGSGGNTNTNTNQAKFFPPRDCLFVNENDGRLHYNGSWTLEADDPTGLRTTTHTTTEAGSQMSVAFSGLWSSGSSISI